MNTVGLFRAPLSQPQIGIRKLLSALLPRQSSQRHKINRSFKNHTVRPKAYSDEGTGSIDEYDFETQFEVAALKLQALEDYNILMQQPEPDLLMGAVLIANHLYPHTDYEDIVEQLDDLAEQIKAKIPKGAYPMRILKIISEYLYQDRGFKGNTGEGYYDVDNSMINKVLEKRLGIPITLALVYQQIAHRCEVDLIGVNTPGHFYLAPADPDLEFLIDVFEGGAISFLEDVEATLSRIYSRPVKLDPVFLQRKEPLPSRMFLSRMLNNLKAIYVMRKEWGSAYTISDYLKATRPGDVEEVRNAGYYLWHMKRYSECAAVLHEYVERAPKDAEDVPKVKRLLRVLKDIDSSASSSSDENLI